MAPRILARGTTIRAGGKADLAKVVEMGHRDLERIVAEIALPNPATVYLHERFGFPPVGTFHRVGRRFDADGGEAWFDGPRRSGGGSPSPAESLDSGPGSPESRFPRWRR